MAVVDEVAQRRTGEARTDDAVAALLQGISSAIGPPFGIPVEAQSPHYAKFGEAVVIDGGSSEVYLPQISRAMIGNPRGVVTVVSTTSTSSITVYCAGQNTVRGSSSDSLSATYAGASYIPIRINEWFRALLT